MVFLISDAIIFVLVMFSVFVFVTYLYVMCASQIDEAKNEADAFEEEENKKGSS